MMLMSGASAAYNHMHLLLAQKALHAALYAVLAQHVVQASKVGLMHLHVLTVAPFTGGLAGSLVHSV